MNTIITWVQRALLLLVLAVGAVIFAAGAAQADSTEPAPPAVPGIIVPQELVDLGNQIGGALQQAQIDATAAYDQAQADAAATVTKAEADIAAARTGVEQAITTALHPAPAPIPAPLEPSVLGSPEADKMVTDMLPKSVPEIVQDVVDPAHEAWLATMYGAPLHIPDVTMDKNAPLVDQIDTTVQLFTVTRVTPNVALCGSNNHLHETACAAGIVEMSKTGSAPMATINVIGKYGFKFYFTEYGTPCYGDVLALQYCDDNIWLSEQMMQYGVAIAEDHDPSLGERVAVIGHEEGHHQDAVAAREDQFYLHLSEDVEHVLASEQAADTEAGRVLQRAVNNGQLSVEEAETGYALFPRLGHTNEDGTPEETHGSAEMRANASRTGQRQVMEEYALAA